jgi:HIV Tat-specific factor 1
MHGRFFGGQRVKAYIYDGKEKFEKQNKSEAMAEQEERLEAFAEWLEQQ